MKPPQNRQRLLSFLGLATYMSSFIASLSSLTAPLRDLTKKHCHFEWKDEHQAAFDQIKNAISKEVTLNYIDAEKPITLQVDVSSTGLGAALLQDGKPVAFASKSLSETE